MRTNGKSAEAEVLRLYRVALANVESNPVIEERLSSLGYDAEGLAIGKQLLNDAESLHQACRDEKEKLAKALHLWSDKREALDKVFSVHRGKFKIFFKNDKLSFLKLGLKGRYQKGYDKWIDNAIVFYNAIASNPDIKEKATMIEIREEDLQDCLKKIEEAEMAYAAYTNLKGESQKTTDLKATKFAIINKWMKEFYDMAKIAFWENPQQVESLGKIVKN